MKSMHSLTKPINIFPTIPEYEILHDHNNCKNIIMSLDLPDELKITNNILNIYTNTEAPEEVIGTQTFYEKQYLEVGKAITYMKFKLRA